MVQPPGVPRFNEDSALKKHWPLLWLVALSALIVASFVPDFNNLGRIFDNQASSTVRFCTNYIYQHSHQRLYYERVVGENQKANPTIAVRKENWLKAGQRFANTVAYNYGYDYENSNSARSSESKAYLKWLFHRQMALDLVGHQDYEAAESELKTALDYSQLLGKKYQAQALSLCDMALFCQLRAVEMQQVAQMLLGAVLPIFSFLAAILPFALFLSFIKSRDKMESSRGESETAGARLCLKTFLLASWFAVIVTGWVALRNYGMGLAAGWTAPEAEAFYCAMAALLLSCCLMLRYMPPYKSLSLKRTMVGFGFGGVLILLKAAAIYWALCFSLASHPTLKAVLFCEPLYQAKAAQAKTFAQEASDCAINTLSNDQNDQVLQAKVVGEMSDILIRDKPREPDHGRVYAIQQALSEWKSEDLVLPQNKNVPYIWNTRINPVFTRSAFVQPKNVHGIELGMTVKACLAYLLFFYPECLAYILLGLKQRALALQTFNRAVRFKEYFLGIDHWLVIGMMELFGSCLLTFHKQVDLSGVGEEYLRQAIARYERSRGRHDQLTIAAKMALAHFFSERNDDKQAERILHEALRDVGKDFDTLAFCALLSELGKLFRRRNNYSRAKQMYKQVIDLLEQKLTKCSPSRGFLGYLRNIYATIPSWQLETKLVCAYLDLAEVFHQAKYNGEAERLTDEANKRIGAFEGEMVTVLEVPATYVRARLALARILCDQGRYDECFKLLAGAKKQLHKWGYGRSALCFEFVVGQCEIELAGSRGFSKYWQVAHKDFQDGFYRFGGGNLNHAPALRERWRVLFESFGIKRTNLIFKTTTATSTSMERSSMRSCAQAPHAHPEPETFSPSWSTQPNAPAAASSPWFSQTPAPAAASSSWFSQTPAPAAASFSWFAPAPASACTPSASEQSSSQEDGIVIRWQRDRKEEVMLELRPERG